MTVGELKKSLERVSDDTIVMIDAVGNPVWYVVEKTGWSDGNNLLVLMDKSGIDLHAEIDAAVTELGATAAIKYLQKNGVTLNELKEFDETLYELALHMY